MQTKKRVFGVFVLVFLVWSFYRAFFVLPEWLEELILKPIAFLLPVFWLVKKEKEDFSSLGFSTKNLFRNIYFGLGLGMAFALLGVLTNYLKYGGISFATFGLTGASLLWLMSLAFATAFSEEVLFRGYIFTRLLKTWKNELTTGIVSAFLFSLIHLPIALFVWHYTLSMLFIQGFLTFLLGFGNAFLMAKTGTIVAPIINHTLWGLTVFLFR